MNKNTDNNNTVLPDEQQNNSRRKFMKKAAYSAPKLMAMGYLLGTTQSSAECDPFTDPNCNPTPSGPIGFYDDKILKDIKKEDEIV